MSNDTVTPTEQAAAEWALADAMAKANFPFVGADAYDSRLVLGGRKILAAFPEGWYLNSAQPASTQKVETAARAVIDNIEPDDDFEGAFQNYLVPFEQIESLRRALEARTPRPILDDPGVEGVDE